MKRKYYKNTLIVVDSENKVIERKEYKYLMALVNHVNKEYLNKKIEYIIENEKLIYKVTL